MNNMIVIQSVTAGKENICQIMFSNDLVLRIHADLVLKYGLSKGTSLSEETLKVLIHNNDLILAKRKAYKYSTYSLRTEQQVVRKLLEDNYSDRIIKQSIDFLKTFNLIDDELYCKKYIEYHTKSKSISSAKLQNELKNKGISHDIAKLAIINYYPVDQIYEIVTKAAEKKMRLLKNKPKDKQKNSLIQFLLRQGFDISIIKAVLCKLLTKSTQIEEDDMYLE